MIFTSVRTAVDSGYDVMAEKMIRLASEQPGFLGVDSAREDVGITVSYWSDLESIRNWKNHPEHEVARKAGREIWYSAFRLRIAKVERDYGM